MEAEWIAQRATLRWQARQHPEWTQEELAASVGRSRSWVAKWLPRLKDTALDEPLGAALALACPSHAATVHAQSRCGADSRHSR